MKWEMYVFKGCICLDFDKIGIIFLYFLAEDSQKPVTILFQISCQQLGSLWYLGKDEGDNQDNEEHAESPQGQGDQQTQGLHRAQRVLTIRDFVVGKYCTDERVVIMNFKC